jgi:hypothetical protein
VASIDQLQQLVSARGKASVPAYMASISTPTGFQHDAWASLGSTLLSSTPHTQHVIIMDHTYSGQAFDYYVAPGLSVNGSVSYTPDLSAQMFMYPEPTSKYDNAVGQVVFARALPAGEAYL